MSTETTPPAAAPTSIQTPPPPPPAVPPVQLSAAPPAASAQPSAPPPQAAVQPSTEPKEGEDPDWLKKRIERARAAGEKNALAAIGVEKPEEAKAAVEAARAAAEAKKTIEQQKLEADQRIAALQKERDELAASVGANAKSALKSLTAEQRDAVTALAGDNPAKQLTTIELLRPTWKAPVADTTDAAKVAAEAAVKAAADAAAKAAQPKAPLPPSATTAPPAGAPPQNPPPAQVDHLAVYESLRTDPLKKMTAAAYFAKFQNAIVAAQRNRAAAQPS